MTTHAGKRTPRSSQSTSVRRAVALILAGTAAARAGQLPIPCAGGACGTGPTAPVGWSTTADGRSLNPGAAYAQSGNRLDVTQKQNSVYLNWQSFNISADATVNFIQPSSTAVALNRIFDASPSQIKGALNSNGQVYLLNQNGFLFGANAVVNVGGLLASSLNISPDAIQNGIAGAITTAGSKGPAFQPYVDANGKALASGSITVQSGAQITSDQGQVLLFAPSVDNEGLIQTPSGQTILGAGQRVFLAVATDAIVRGLVIEVGNGGTVTNGPTGQIISTTGNVTIAGLAVKQDGRVSATTTVRSNGSIRLQARDTNATSANGIVGDIHGLPNRSGTLELGPSSTTSVTLQGSSTDTTVDVNSQPQSVIELDGGTIQLQDHASVVAPSGNVTLNALSDTLNATVAKLGDVGVPPDQARIWLAPTSTIDVSGADITLPMERNSLSVQLRGSQLADFPQQRNGALRGQTVSVDLRQYGKRADGSPWIGTPIADLSGDVSAIQRDVFERNLTGGTINLNASGSVLVSQGATLNVSGGRIDWQSGYVKSSVLLGADGKTYPIASADPSRSYVGTLDAISQDDPHWGTKVTVTLPIRNSQGQYLAGYTEGKDAGSINIVSPAVVLDGTLNGGVTVGPYQRLASTTTWTTGQLYRPYDQVPLGGMLTVGNAKGFQDTTQTHREVLQNVTFAPGTVLNTLTGTGGKPFNPAVDPLPANFVTSLSPDLLGSSGMSRLNVYAEGNITVPQGVSLAPGAGGSVTLAAGRIDLAGSADIPGGTVSLSTAPTIAHPGQASIFGSDPHGGLPGLTLEPSATIDVRGEWINDDPLVSAGAILPLFTSGGQVSLSSTGGSLIVPSGSVIDVSGGAQRTASGSLVGGAAGSIAISGSPGLIAGTDQPQFTVAGLLEGYALSTGGSLSLALPELCVSSLPCTETGFSRADPNLFTDFGFAQVGLQATLGSLTVASDVNITARQQNLLFLPGAFSRPSARSLAGLTRVTVLPDNVRKPESVSLTSSSNGLVEQGRPLPYALAIADGARIALDPGGSLAVKADSKIFQNGTLIAPGGQVTVLLTQRTGLGAASAGYFADQAIWLGPNSLIDVSGVLQSTPNDFNLQLGSVLPGGSVSVQAQGGYLFAAPGAALTAAGTTATLDLRSPGKTSYSRTQVGSAGGSISLFAAEGMQFDGTLSAPAGAGSTASGGSLSITLDGSFGGARTPDYYPASVSAPRDLIVLSAPSPIVVAEGSPVPSLLNGKGEISASAITAGGFDSVALTARNLSSSAVGSVSFQPGVSLSPAARLVVDAPQIRAGGTGGVVTLHSDYVALGSTDTFNQAVNTTPTAGTSQLAVSGRLVDLVGAFDLAGFNSPSITSTGDLRVVGVQSTVNGPYVGALTVPGALSLSAQQMYPTTLTSYAINVIKSGTKSSQLTLSGQPGQAGAVLSAAGSLSLQADQITDAGVLRAPVGSISLTGRDVTLSPGAVISVSANGLTIPFGQTQGGLDWIYQLSPGSGGLTQVYGIGTGDLLLPQKQVNLTADKLTVNQGATIDLSGGGDLLAYEYVPGLGGNTDVLLPKSQRPTTFAPDVFAIVPSLNLPYAPIDPHEDLGFAKALAGSGFTQSVGASVYLSGGNGLAAGTYTILPARYALLPGAYLVKPVSGYMDLASGQTVAQLDGSAVVSGYRTYGGTGHGDTRTSGFDITPGSYALQEAQYNLTGANSFFTAQASAAKVNTPRLPADAGDLAIRAISAVELQGQLLTNAPTGGRGATVDLSSQNLIITSDPQSAPAGSVALDPGQLNALGAESILIGGLRSAAVNATNVSMVADTVTVDQGVQLSAQELVFVAKNSVAIDANASVLAKGAAVAPEAPLQVAAGTAVVRTSTGSLTKLQSTGTGGSGQITVASGAVVGAPGSVSFDAGGLVSFAGNLSAAGAAIRLGANQIALGAVPQTFNGFAIGSSLFAGISNSDLELSSPNPIDIYGSVALTLAKLRIAAPGIIDVTPDAALAVSVGDLTIASPDTKAFSGTTSGPGSVQLSATHVTLAGGTFTVAGSKNTILTAAQDLTATSDGALGTAGDLRLESAVTQSGAGINYNFTAAGDLTTALRGSATGTTTASGPGGALSFTGRSVTLGGNIILPAGSVTATASGTDVTVADGASINVAGFGVVFDGKSQSAPGGAIKLASNSGNVSVASTAILDISAGTGAASGGSLSLLAPLGAVTMAGTLHASGGIGQSGGDLTVDAQTFDFPGLVSLASAAGLTGRWDLRERGLGGGSGDLVLATGATLRASAVSLTTDQGSVEIFGTIDASSDLGGQITLAAGNNVEVAGTLLAGSKTRADRGGTISLLSSNGAVWVDSGARLSVGGAGSSSTGTVWLRAPAQNVLSVLSDTAAHQVRLDGTITGAANVYLEGYKSYNYDTLNRAGLNWDTLVSADPVNNPLFAGATTFMQTVTQNAAAFSKVLGSGVTVLPGVELDASGDLHVAPSASWDLSTWRFGTDSKLPGVLTVRAGGNLYVDKSISDGVAYVTDPFAPLPLLGAVTGASWSYRLAAGADLTSANPLAVRNLSELPALQLGPDTGNLIVAPGTPLDPANAQDAATAIRTGTGFINIATAADLRLGNQASVIYTIGAAGTEIPVKPGTSNFQLLPYPTGGGTISVSAGRDVVGHTSNQLFTDWLWRTGSDKTSPYVATTWTPSVSAFEQGIGALGGGDLTVRAGRNIVDLGANVPSVGRPVGDPNQAGTTTQEVNNGVLSLFAGGDISGGKFLDMAGQAFIRAGGGLTAGTPQNGADNRGLYPVIAVGSGQFDVTARGSISIETVLNPTLLPQSVLETGTGGAAPQQFFSTYADSSSVSLLSVGSDVVLVNQAAFPQSLLQKSATNLGFGTGTDNVDLRMYAPSLAAVSLGGDVRVTGSMDLWPSAHGNLDLLAANSVLFQQTGGNNGLHVLMSDADPTLLPRVGNLAEGSYLAVVSYFTNLDATGPDDPTAPVPSHASKPLHGGAYSPDQQPDSVPARIVAKSGDVSVTVLSSNQTSLISIPKQLDLVAGRDISNLRLTVQQYAASNASNIIAGRDITYPTSRLANGALAPNLGAIVFDGPGRGSIRAGRNINLGTSDGIVSEGNLHNAALPVGGAALSVAAGIPGTPDYQSFIDTYLAKSDVYDQNLIQYMEGIDGTSQLSKTQALAEFKALTASQQAALIETVFFAELRAGGRSAAALGPTHNNYTRAFAALTTLFPGSNPNLTAGEKDPYQGDLLLYFSRIYTLQGGDINLLAPGGQVNVGLATAPAAFGVSKLPSQLGIVAQSTGSINILSYNDIQVNQSRVFAADGGGILMWSTEGNIDAGRGAKTAISAPPPTVTVDPTTGAVTVNFPQALTGSGIQALATTKGTSPGDVDLFAPHGVVNANDAGIVAGNLTIAATAVLGANNISVSGKSVGLPPDVTGLGASLASASSAGSAATSTGESNAMESSAKADKAPLASTALNWLDVLVLGLGEDQCKTDDLECIKRQAQH